MKKFLVVYLAPVEGMEAWANMDPEVTKAEEAKMEAEWNQWMEAHKKHFVEESVAIGKTKRITAEGVSDAKNDMMIYSIVEANSHEEAAALFVDHPHFTIPEASIEVMPLTPLSEMGK